MGLVPQYIFRPYDHTMFAPWTQHHPGKTRMGTSGDQVGWWGFLEYLRSANCGYGTCSRGALWLQPYDVYSVLSNLCSDDSRGTRVTRRIYRSRFLQKCWTWTGFSQGGGIERRKKSDWLLSPSNAARLTARTMPWNGTIPWIPYLTYWYF